MEKKSNTDGFAMQENITHMTPRNNLVSLKEYIDTRFEAMEKAVTIANATMDKRLEGMNEFRSSLKDASALYFTRAEHQAYLEKVDADIRVLRESKAALEGKASAKSVIFATIIAVIGITLSVASLFHSFVTPTVVTPAIVQPTTK